MKVESECWRTIAVPATLSLHNVLSVFSFYPHVNKNLERSHLFKRTEFIARAFHTFKQLSKKHFHILEVKCIEVKKGNK